MILNRRCRPHHCNTSCYSNQYQSLPQTRLIRQECPGQSKLPRVLSVIWYPSFVWRARSIRTITSGAMIQLMTRLNAIWIQRPRLFKTRCNVSYLTLQRIGYIMTSRPTAIHHQHSKDERTRDNLPRGTETPTNFPFCKAGPTLETKLPNKMPIAMAKRIHIAKSRSSSPRALKAEVCFGSCSVFFSSPADCSISPGLVSPVLMDILSSLSAVIEASDFSSLPYEERQ